MSKIDDMIAALERRQPSGAVPVWELEFHAWDSVSGGHIVLGREFESLSAVEQEKTLQSNAEMLLAAAAELNFAALTVPGNYWEQAPGQPAFYWLPGDWRYRQIEVLRTAAPPDLMLVAVGGGVMGMPGAREYVEFCYRLIDEPDAIIARAEQTLRGGIANARRLIDCGAAAIVSASDIADNSGPFYSPAQMDRFILPYLRAWAAAVREMGAFTILHTDGNLLPGLAGIADSGVQALQAVDPVAGMDMRQTKDLVGDRLCLCGNVDCGLLLTATPERVYDATRELLVSCKAGGGLVLGCSNAVQPEVPITNYRAMIAAWREHGQYGR